MHPIYVVYLGVTYIMGIPTVITFVRDQKDRWEAGSFWEVTRTAGLSTLLFIFSPVMVPILIMIYFLED